MKKSLVILIALSFSMTAMAQESNCQKELGIVFSSLNSFGMTFKSGTEKSLWRFQTVLISGSSVENNNSGVVRKDTDLGFGFQIGKEFRKKIIDQVELRLGGDLSFSYNSSKEEFEYESVLTPDRTSKRTTIRPGLKFVFGLNYVIKDRLVIGAELMPGFSYMIGKRKEKVGDTEEMEFDDSGLSFGISNGSALLSIAVRF